MTTIKNIENLRQYKNIFYLIVEKVLPSTSSTNLQREFRNVHPIFKRIA